MFVITDAILLQNGDIVIMTHQARQSYHAVPKILAANEGNLEPYFFLLSNVISLSYLPYDDIFKSVFFC